MAHGRAAAGHGVMAPRQPRESASTLTRQALPELGALFRLRNSGLPERQMTEKTPKQ
jgi:hypothetical protein